mgnify:CR=1 FL=1
MRKIGEILRFLIPVIALAALVVFMTGAGRRERATLEKNKAIVMRYADEVWNKGNMAVADELEATNFIRYIDTVPEGVIRGREADKKFCMGVRTAWPDYHWVPVDVFAQGDKVAIRGAESATFTGQLEGWPAPNGKKIAYESVLIFRIAGGKIVEIRGFYQDLVMMYGMGLKLVPAEQPGK